MFQPLAVVLALSSQCSTLLVCMCSRGTRTGLLLLLPVFHRAKQGTFAGSQTLGSGASMWVVLQCNRFCLFCQGRCVAVVDLTLCIRPLIDEICCAGHVLQGCEGQQKEASCCMHVFYKLLKYLYIMVNAD